MAAGTGVGNKGYDSFLEPKKESKKAACDVKVKLIKLGVALATRPVAGESLNRPDESTLSSGRSLLFPFGLASPALASSCAVRCPAGMVGRGKQAWLTAIVDDISHA